MSAESKTLVSNYDDSLQKAAGSIRGILDASFARNAAYLHVCIPVRVMAYDRKTRQMTVKPLVKRLTREGGFKTNSPFNIKAWQYAANGFVIDLPIKSGDVGWVIAADRDTRLVTESHQESELEDTRTHTYEDGFFIPDFYGTLKTANRKQDYDTYVDDANRMVITTLDGSQRISIGPGDMEIFSSSVNVYANTASVKTEGQVKIDAPQFTVTGVASLGNGASGLITPNTVAEVQNGVVVSLM